MSTYWLKLQDMRFPLRLGETLLGRSPYCSIVLNDNLVSRQHAVVHVTRDGLYIEDLGSRNGTRVNRALVTGQHPLYPGDRIQIGQQLIEVELGSREDRVRLDTLSVTGDHTLRPLEGALETPTEPGRAPQGSYSGAGAHEAPPASGAGAVQPLK